MPLLGFKKRFAPLVEAGTKRTTIRKKRKDGRNPHPGETLFLYTGLRTKHCRKLRPDEICKSVEEITIHCGGRIIVACKELNESEKNQVAVADGFSNASELVTFLIGRAHV